MANGPSIPVSEGWPRVFQDVTRAIVLVIVGGLVLLMAASGTVQLVREAILAQNLSFEDIFPTPRAMRTSGRCTAIALNDHIQTLGDITLSIALVLGVLIAALMDFSNVLRWILYPILVISQTIPIFAIAILLILIFGFGSGPKVMVVVLFCFFPIALNTFAGLQAADPELLSLLRAMGATSLQTWTKARLPAAMPSLFSGLRIAATYSVVGAIFGEYITAQQGLGVYLKRSYASFQLDQAYLAILLTALLSLLLVLLVNLVERLTLRWYYTSRRSSWRGPGIY